MSEFIERSFKNFDSELVPIFKNVENDTFVFFNELIKQDSSVLIIGEGGIGKTYQFKKYQNNHKNTHYIDCTNLEENSKIEKNIEIVLIDSIDEAIAISEKIFITRCTEYIQECKKINPYVKFIISSRLHANNQVLTNILKDAELVLEVYTMMYPKNTSTFSELVTLSNLLIILGEPASGKTYQLSEYAKNNQHTHFTPLVTLKENDSISADTQVVLIDSIDEALTQNNQKTLARDLKEYILRCKEANPKVRFVISCRFLEWSEYFKNELKTVDNELREYEILPLSKKDINNLLAQKSINSGDFLDFVYNNFLESLFSNILITIYLIDNFRDYENRKVTYITIYYDLSRKYLSEQGEDRENNLQGIALNKLLTIASSLAAYLLLNRKENIESTNLNFIASELYKIDGENIVAADLEIVLNSNLYKKVDNKFLVFHESIQEYLMAYFITQRNLNTETIKKLFASSLRFYEEFEEVIVYLTNLKPELFDELVGFDPFIFKRHPNLTKAQQEKLLLSILNKYKVDFSQVWGRWESFEDSTLVRFEKLDNLIGILQEHATLKEHGYYLMKLLVNNYTDELKEYVFELFENNISDEKTLKNVIRGNFINNYEFNISLYKFLKKHNLLKKDTHTFMMSFEAELFSSLYGIKYKYKYGDDRIAERTNIDFNTIMPLLDFVPANSLKYIAPYLLKIDAEELFQYIVGKYAKDKYNYEFMGWVVHAVLRHCDSVDSLIKIAKNVEEKKIYLHSTDKEEMNLDFKVIEDIFWEVYFEKDVLQDFCANEIVSLYDISLDDIKKATYKYPIENYIEKFVYFRPLGDDVDIFLMQNKDFNEYMQNEWKRQERQKKVWDKERKEKYPDTVKKKEDGRLFRIECLDRFDTEEEKTTDYHNIFRFAFNKNHDNVIKIDKSLQEKLSEKYPEYILRIKLSFKADILYKEIKNDLFSSSIYYDTLIYNYLFEILNDKELRQIIKTKKDYIKLFWHVYRKSLNSFRDKFIKLSENYFDCFVLLSLHVLQINIKQSESEKIGHFNLFIHAFKELNKFDKDSMKSIINYLIKDKSIIPKLKEFYEKEYLLEVLVLDKNNYSYILDLISHDDTNMDTYLQYLLKIDINKGFEDFYKIYEKEKRYKSIWARFIRRLTNDKETGYNNQIINPKKTILLQVLIKSINSNKLNYEEVNSKYLKFILKDYYEFFLEYNTPKGAYSPDIYDNMYRVIRNIWNSFENNTQHINLLKELAQDKNETLSNLSRYALTKSYEQQEKDRNYSNSYYKEMFDIQDTQENDVPYQKDIIVKPEKWYKKWLFISLVIGIFVFIISYWNFKIPKISLILGILSFALTLFFNPKRRFFRVAITILAIGTMSMIPSLIDVISKILNLNIATNPWIGGLLILSSLFLFWLDHKENED